MCYLTENEIYMLTMGTELPFHWKQKGRLCFCLNTVFKSMLLCQNVIWLLSLQIKFIVPPAGWFVI